MTASDSGPAKRPAKPASRKAEPAGSPRTAKPRKRPVKEQQRAEKMEQILDAAEYLFYRPGLHGVTLKDVAKQVGAHHTLVNYYFTDKKTLFDAVFSRRAVVTSSLRMEALDAYEAACGGRPTVEGALRAFLDTDLDLYIQGGENWKNYGALGAQVAEYLAADFAIDSHSYGSLFFVVGGFHSILLAIGLGMLLLLLLWSVLGYFDEVHHEPVTAVSLYWYFVAAVWLPTGLIVYLTPHIF
jgi:AcrR family transcriptional regulator